MNRVRNGIPTIGAIRAIAGDRVEGVGARRQSACVRSQGLALTTALKGKERVKGERRRLPMGELQ